MYPLDLLLESGACMNKNYNIKALLPLFLLLLLATGAWCYYYNNAFIALPYNDAMDYASMARNISLGRGFTSRYITPLSLAHYGAPYPNLWRGPLWPLFLAGYFRFFPATDSVVATASGFFYLIALFPFITWLKNWREISRFSELSSLYLQSPALFYSVSGMTESWPFFSWFMGLSSA